MLQTLKATSSNALNKQHSNINWILLNSNKFNQRFLQISLDQYQVVASRQAWCKNFGVVFTQILMWFNTPGLLSITNNLLAVLTKIYDSKGLIIVHPYYSGILFQWHDP